MHPCLTPPETVFQKNQHLSTNQILMDFLHHVEALHDVLPVEFVVDQNMFNQTKKTPGLSAGPRGEESTAVGQ